MAALLAVALSTRSMSRSASPLRAMVTPLVRIAGPAPLWSPSPSCAPELQATAVHVHLDELELPVVPQVEQPMQDVRAGWVGRRGEGPVAVAFEDVGGVRVDRAARERLGEGRHDLELAGDRLPPPRLRDAPRRDL